MLLPNRSGIYTITNILDGKMYVGYTSNLRVRKNDHWSELRRNGHYNVHLQGAWNKYGEAVFIYDILVECEEQFLYSEEHYWCNILNVHDDKYGYNTAPTNPHGIFQVKSEETRKKLSVSNKGKKRSQETKDRVRNSLLGKKQSDTHKANRSKALKGKPQSEEIKQKRREIAKEKGAPQKAIDASKRIVCQYTTNGEVVKEYESMRGAARETNTGYSTIYRHCIGMIENPRVKYTWKYKNDN